jgi:NAD(P)-dependent dehydrogenase (short-subunit alcohol dehydrogenase family)
LVSRTEKELKDLTDHINNQGFKGSYEVMDVKNEDEVSNFINNAEPFDILINNAGTNRPAKLIDTKIEDFDYVMSLNVRSVISLTKLVVKKMLDSNIRGSIINVSSQMGHVGGPNRTTYCSSKFAIEGFTKSLAIELGPDGIRVNAICPTFIQTPMTEPFLKDEDFKKTTIGMIPIGRLGEVTDLMGPFVFLASEASSLMTGSSILVDGGWTAR